MERDPFSNPPDQTDPIDLTRPDQSDENDGLNADDNDINNDNDNNIISGGNDLASSSDDENAIFPDQTNLFRNQPVTVASPSPPLAHLSRSPAQKRKASPRDASAKRKSARIATQRSDTDDVEASFVPVTDEMEALCVDLGASDTLSPKKRSKACPPPFQVGKLVGRHGRKLSELHPHPIHQHHYIHPHIHTHHPHAQTYTHPHHHSHLHHRQTQYPHLQTSIHLLYVLKKRKSPKKIEKRKPGFMQTVWQLKKPNEV
ncbi:unnamed protein product, partial [Meganyctiphanes norvegica]